MNAVSGYVDLQVNGYADVDFNADELNGERVAAVCEQMRSEGVAGILATVITGDLDAMCRRIANVVRVCEADRNVGGMIWGVHIEGPFLNAQPGYIGAHPKNCARPADIEGAKRLVDAAGGMAKVFTLAPERDEKAKVTKWLSGQGIHVAAGHCNPTLEEFQAAIDAGLSLFTHLGNGCPAMLPRHDNIIQRALRLSDRLHVGFIADGVHVPFVALANYIKCCGMDRAFIVTDAIRGAGLGPGEYSIGDLRVVVDENLATWSADRSHLMGSAGTMPRTAENLKRALGYDDRQIKQLLCDNPRTIVEAA